MINNIPVYNNAVIIKFVVMLSSCVRVLLIQWSWILMVLLLKDMRS